MSEHTTVLERLNSAPTLDVEETALVLGVSRSAAYAAARTGELPTIRVGRRLRVPSVWVRQQLRLDTAED